MEPVQRGFIRIKTAIPYAIVGAGVVLILAALLIDFVRPSPHYMFGPRQLAYMAQGSLLIVIVSWMVDRSRWIQGARMAALSLWVMAAFGGLALYPDQWSWRYVAGFLLVAASIGLSPALRSPLQRLGAGLGRVIPARLIENLATSLLALTVTFAAVAIPFELLLRSDYSVYHLFGFQGRTPNEYPERLIPSLNSLGFRDTEHPIEKPAGVIRIVILGDSFTYGHGAADDEIYPYMLGQMAGPQVEFISLAKPGWSTADQLNALREVGLAYDPDIVIVGAYANDPGPRVGRGDPGDLQPPWLIFRRLPVNSAVFTFLDAQINRLAGLWGWRESYFAWEDALYDPEKGNWPRFQAVVRELGALLDAHEIPAYAFMLPGPIDPRINAQAQKYVALTREFTEAGFYTTNLLPDYLKEIETTPSLALWVLPNDFHAGPPLNGFYAREIWKVLQPAVEKLQDGLRDRRR